MMRNSAARLMLSLFAYSIVSRPNPALFVSPLVALDSPRTRRARRPNQGLASTPGGLRRRHERGPMWRGTYTGPNAELYGEGCLVRRAEKPGHVLVQFNNYPGLTHTWIALPRHHFRFS